MATNGQFEFGYIGVHRIGEDVVERGYGVQSHCLEQLSHFFVLRSL